MHSVPGCRILFNADPNLELTCKKKKEHEASQQIPHMHFCRTWTAALVRNTVSTFSSWTSFLSSQPDEMQIKFDKELRRETLTTTTRAVNEVVRKIVSCSTLQTTHLLKRSPKKWKQQNMLAKKKTQQIGKQTRKQSPADGKLANSTFSPLDLETNV